MNHGVQEVLDFTLDLMFAELYGIYWNHLGNFNLFLGFTFVNWNVTNFSIAVLKISPISAWLWTYFFQQGRKLVDICGISMEYSR